MGATAKRMFEDEKPAMLTQIEAECDKYKGQSLPIPSRGGKRLVDYFLIGPLGPFCLTFVSWDWSVLLSSCKFLHLTTMASARLVASG